MAEIPHLDMSIERKTRRALDETTNLSAREVLSVSS